MEWVDNLFRPATDLSSVEMLLRGIAVFIIAVMLLRVAGKKTFGKQSPEDNVIMIMLGAILSRSVVGSSPFIPVIITCAGIVLFHRSIAWLGSKNKKFSAIVKGEKISLYKDGEENIANMKSELVTKEELLEGIRSELQENNFEKVKEIFIERNGRLTVVKK